MQCVIFLVKYKPVIFLLTVQTLVGFPGSSETAISET